MTNDTLLRGYLSRLQANARELAALDFERAAHPDATAPIQGSRRREIVEAWEVLRRELPLVLGFDATLKPWGALAAPGSFSRWDETGRTGRDPFRVTMGVFKERCDKARRKHPELTLMKSWDKDEHRPPPVSDVWNPRKEYR
jgi:hypothetical protein